MIMPTLSHSLTPLKTRRCAYGNGSVLRMWWNRIPVFIEQVYNKKRVHSGIQYLPPEEFEAMLLDEHKKQTLGQITLRLHD